MKNMTIRSGKSKSVYMANKLKKDEKEHISYFAGVFDKKMNFFSTSIAGISRTSSDYRFKNTEIMINQCRKLYMLKSGCLKLKSLLLCRAENIKQLVTEAEGSFYQWMDNIVTMESDDRLPEHQENDHYFFHKVNQNSPTNSFMNKINRIKNQLLNTFYETDRQIKNTGEKLLLVAGRIIFSQHAMPRQVVELEIINKDLLQIQSQVSIKNDRALFSFPGWFRTFSAILLTDMHVLFRSFKKFCIDLKSVNKSSIHDFIDRKSLSALWNQAGPGYR